MGSFAFENFPSDFSTKSNFILDIFGMLSENGTEVSEVAKEHNFYFSGCYTNDQFWKKSLNRIKAEFSDRAMTRWLELQGGLDHIPNGFSKTMWITFENRRPPFSSFQRTLSFDIDDYSGTNLYLPLWLVYLDMFGRNPPWSRHSVTQDSLFAVRTRRYENREFACAFINNPNQLRLRAIEKLSAIGKVDVYGRMTGNYVKDKIEVSKRYKFSICFENDLFPGYVTEKPLEAWLGDTVPLYWGYDKESYLNTKCMINLNSFDSLNEFVKYVEIVNKDELIYNALYSEPFLSRRYDTNSLLDFFRQWILEEIK